MKPTDPEVRTEIDEIRRALAAILRQIDEVGARLNELTRRLYGYPLRSDDSRPAFPELREEAGG